MSAVGEAFCGTGFARFLNSPAGRLARIIIGAGLIYWGYTRLTTPTGLAFMIIGLIPLAAGLFNLCLICALLGGPVSGADIARRNRSPSGG